MCIRDRGLYTPKVLPFLSYVVSVQMAFFLLEEVPYDPPKDSNRLHRSHMGPLHISSNKKVSARRSCFFQVRIRYSLHLPTSKDFAVFLPNILYRWIRSLPVRAAAKSSGSILLYRSVPDRHHLYKLHVHLSMPHQTSPYCP